MSYRKKTVSKIAAVLFCLAAAAAMASCGAMGSFSGGSSQEILKQSVDAFNRAFRWEDYRAASVWVDQAKRERFWTEVDNFKGKVRIIDYQIREINHPDKAPIATAIVTYQYWRTDSPTLQTVTLTQKWYFSETVKAWQVGQSGFQKITGSPVGF
jgi:hypothetical protein